MNNYNIVAYCIYLSISTIITVFVGSNLHKNGYFLVLDLFKNELFSKTLNNLLLTGYYLVNIGYIAIAVQWFDQVSSLQILMQNLADRLAWILLILGVLHLNNIIMLRWLSAHRTKVIHMFNYKK